MSAGEQLAMFEPKGQELADLAKRYMRLHEDSLRISESMELRDMQASASMFRRYAAEEWQMACRVESALQFEQLAGLA